MNRYVKSFVRHFKNQIELEFSIFIEQYTYNICVLTKEWNIQNIRPDKVVVVSKQLTENWYAIWMKNEICLNIASIDFIFTAMLAC